MKSCLYFLQRVNMIALGKFFVILGNHFSSCLLVRSSYNVHSILLLAPSYHRPRSRRNLNHWGFSQIKKVDSPDNKSYYHDYFLRTKMDLTHMIKRVKDPKFTLSRTSVYKYGMPFQEPNFHEMEWLPAQTKKQKEEKKRCYSTSSALSSSSSLRAVSISPAMMSSRSDTGMIVATTRYNDSHDDMDVDKRNDDLLRPKLSNRENNHHASVNSIIEPASLRIDQLERYYSTESSTIRSFTSSNQERTSFTEINPPLQEEQATNSAAMTSNLDCNEGNIWDDNNWQQFLIEQYMLLPKDLSVLNSVFDHESCLT